MTTKTVVTIECRVPNGIELRLHKPGPDDGTGVKMVAKDGCIVLRGPSSLPHGTNDTGGVGGQAVLNDGIDAAMADAWFKANATNPLVTGGHVAIVAREEK